MSGATAATPARPSRRLSELLPLLLAVVAEGAWLSVVAGLVDEYGRQPPVLGVAQLALLAGAGAAAAGLAAPRLGRWWPYLAVGLAAAGVVAGVLAAPQAREIVAADGLAGLGRALGVHPAGVVGGLAVLRGAGYVRWSVPGDRLETLLLGGTLAIVACGLAGGIAPDPWRARFVADALGGAVVFAATALIAVALRRQTAESRDRGAEWQRNPRWVALLGVVVVTIAVLSALAAGLVRPTVEMLFALLLLPVIVLGLVFGWTRRGVLQALVFAVIGLIVAIALNFGGGLPRVEPDGGAPPGAELPEPTPLEPSVVALGSALVVALAVIAAFVLVRWWTRRVPREPDDPNEERFIDRRARAAPATPSARHWLRRRAPTDAAEAYRALLLDIDRREDVRREPSETPREHAARLRAAHSGGLPLELLAADYGLLAFGNQQLSERERRRAIDRWRRLRRSLRQAEPPETA